MGWYITYNASLADIIRERTQAWTWNDGSGTTNQPVARKLAGNVLWQIREVVHPALGVQDRYIECDLLTRTQEGAGYKPMDESMGPYYYSCPLSWLDEVPEVSAEWRAGVRKYWAKRAAVAALKPGQTVALQNSVVPEVRLVRKRGRTWLGVRDGITYRIPADLIKLEVPA